MSSEPYDPYIPGGAPAGSMPPTGGSSKTAAIQAQIDDTVGIMRENITKVAERGERLDALQDKTGMYSRLLLECCGAVCRRPVRLQRVEKVDARGGYDYR